jgi:hypothetical protein
MLEILLTHNSIIIITVVSIIFMGVEEIVRSTVVEATKIIVAAIRVIRVLCIARAHEVKVGAELQSLSTITVFLKQHKQLALLHDTSAISSATPQTQGVSTPSDCTQH